MRSHPLKLSDLCLGALIAFVVLGGQSWHLRIVSKWVTPARGICILLMHRRFTYLLRWPSIEYNRMVLLMPSRLLLSLMRLWQIVMLVVDDDTVACLLHFQLLLGR